MRKILLATHGILAEAIRKSIDTIVGETGNIDTLCAYTNDSFDLKAEIAKKLSVLSAGDELIVATDVLGGSINNEFMMSMKKFQFYLLTGVNLAMAVELSSAHPALPARQVVEEAVKSAREGILICNDLDGDTAEDDF